VAAVGVRSGADYGRRKIKIKIKIKIRINIRIEGMEFGK
jgi:hypothetical protein